MALIQKIQTNAQIQHKRENKKIKQTGTEVKTLNTNTPDLLTDYLMLMSGRNKSIISFGYTPTKHGTKDKEFVSFIPMLMDTGGNCGSQSSTLIIRGLALSQVRFKDIFRVIFKEFRISLIVGAVLALTNGIRIMIQYDNAGLALVIALSLIGTVIVAKMVGCILPLLASKIHLDPAIMASPLITTLVDIFSILIYFNIATMLFNL